MSSYLVYLNFCMNLYMIFLSLFSTSSQFATLLWKLFDLRCCSNNKLWAFIWSSSSHSHSYWSVVSLAHVFSFFNIDTSSSSIFSLSSPTIFTLPLPSTSDFSKSWKSVYGFSWFFKYCQNIIVVSLVLSTLSSKPCLCLWLFLLLLYIFCLSLILESLGYFVFIESSDVYTLC